MICPKCEAKFVTEDGLTYCPRCAYEPKESQALPAVPPAAEAEPPVVEVQSAAALGRGCIQRAEVLTAEIVKLQSAIAGRAAEVQKLVKVAEFCEVAIPASLTKIVAIGKAKSERQPRQPRADGAPRKSWTCPDCGHQTVSRWVARHREECPAKAAAS